MVQNEGIPGPVDMADIAGRCCGVSGERGADTTAKFPTLRLS